MMMKGNEMNRYSDLTIDQIRGALYHMELNYSMAMDSQSYGLASAFRSKIELLQEALVARITAEDPYTSEADVRYFEGLAC